MGHVMAMENPWMQWKLSTWSIKTTLLEDQILIIGVDVTRRIISLNRDLGSQEAVVFDAKREPPPNNLEL